MDELSKLRDKLSDLLSEANDELGGEKVQPYICILEGVLKGINKDIDTEMWDNI